jgi:hypothetical protein|tara:strand:+ start:80 stop:445 length:366 start_codon:yes stop_codon:yes gene_type:complete
MSSNCHIHSEIDTDCVLCDSNKAVLVTEDKVVLSSVGSVIDKSTGITYPIMADDTIGWDEGTHIHDIENEEWFDSLSTNDLDIVTEVSDSFLSDKEKHDFDEAVNGELMGPDGLPLNFPFG